MANNFKPFATGAGANVMSQADWEALAALQTGFQSGKASSAQINKAIRQASFIAAALAQFVSEKSGQDVLDDGDLSGFVEKMTNGFAAEYLSRENPFGDIKADGAAAISTALTNLGLGTAAKLSAAVATQASPGYLLIPALVSGVEKQLILQWGSFAGLTSGDTAVTFPFPFPNQCWHVFPNALVTGTGAFAGCNSPTKTGFNGNMWASNTVRQSGTSSYWALGF